VTLSGDTFRFLPGNGTSLVIHALNASDAFSAAMWNGNYSVDSFLVDMEDNPGVTASTDVVLASWGGPSGSDAVAARDAAWMQSRLSERAAELGWTAAKKARVLSRVRFASQAVGSWAQWVPATLAAWPHNVTTIRSAALAGPVTRLDGEYTVFPWAAEPAAGPWPLADGGAGGCSSMPPAGTANGSALVVGFASDANGYPADPASCSFAAMGMAATKAGASALILHAVPAPGAPQRPLAQPNCSAASSSCASGGVPVTVVAASAGAALRAAAPGSTAAFEDVPAPAGELVIGADGALQQAGWRKFALLRILTWAAQFASYNRALQANLTLPGARLVPVFQRAEMKGHQGVVRNVTMPSRAELAEQGRSRIELDVSLGCEGPLDESCPAWDRVLSLHACCRDAGSAAGACDRFELGRWITPFRRGVGRWTTDVSPLAAALIPWESTVCELQMTTDWWAKAWYPSLTLRFVEPQPDRAPAAAASAAAGVARPPVSSWGLSNGTTFLFSGGSFNASYNDNRSLTVDRPPWATRAALYTVITGHGSDNNGCGEFCSTEHIFAVNGANRSVAFDDAGDFWGSTYSVVEGTIPSQHGTWAFGRDGWYDGNKVRPWVVDVSDLVTASSEVTYMGLFQGHTPHPTADGAVIIMSSWLVWWP